MQRVRLSPALPGRATSPATVSEPALTQDGPPKGQGSHEGSLDAPCLGLAKCVRTCIHHKCPGSRVSDTTNPALKILCTAPAHHSAPGTFSCLQILPFLDVPELGSYSRVAFSGCHLPLGHRRGRSPPVFLRLDLSLCLSSEQHPHCLEEVPQ